MRFPTAILATVTLLAVALVPTNTSAVTGKDCYAFDPNPPTTVPVASPDTTAVIPSGSTTAPSGDPHCVYYATGTFMLAINPTGAPPFTDCSESQQGLSYACAYLPAEASDNNASTGGDDYFVADFAQLGNTGDCGPLGASSSTGTKDSINEFAHRNPAVPTAANAPAGVPRVCTPKITSPQVCFLDVSHAPINCWTPVKYTNRVGDGLCKPISTEPRIVPTGAVAVAWTADLGVQNVADIYVFNCPPFPQ